MSLHQAYLNTKYFASLDGVRCFCILAVIWHHSPIPQGLPAIANRGFLGVDMFFVLSGFLIATLLLREKQKYNHINLNIFYQRRSLRIFPAYYGLLLIFTVLYGIQLGTSESSQQYFQVLPFYATFTSNWVSEQANNFAILWSLATEEQFYLIWPAVEQYFPKGKILWVLTPALLINQLINFGWLDPLFEIILGTSHLEILDSTFTPILLGIALAYGLQSERGFTGFSFLGKSFWSPLLITALMLVMIQISPPDLSGLPRLLIQLIMTALLAALVMPKSHCFGALLQHPWVVRIGVISYGMYLYHTWCIHVVREAGQKVGWEGGIWMILPSILITYIVAEISFRWLETPFLKLKPQRVSERSPSPPPNPHPKD
jgi:hypothetical protein